MPSIFTVRQMQKNFRVKGKKLYFGFVGLGKAFDRVPRNAIRWAVRKLGVEEWSVSAVMLWTRQWKAELPAINSPGGGHCRLWGRRLKPVGCDSAPLVFRRHDNERENET